jgi:hypothetical protein
MRQKIGTKQSQEGRGAKGDKNQTGKRRKGNKTLSKKRVKRSFFERRKHTTSMC